jgi:acetolactate synthase-1/3 small subunit
MNAHSQKINHTILELVVNNHPGVMSHVCGLFSRRTYNLEGIVCIPADDGATSKIMLQVNEYQRLDQVRKQLAKLPDVLTIDQYSPAESIFEKIKKYC